MPDNIGSGTKGGGDPGWFSRIGGDIRGFAAGLLPQNLIPALFHEGEALPQLPGIIGKASQEPFGQAVHDVANAPGLRMVPGVSTVGDLFSAQGRHEIAMHPLLNFLNVLPFANRFANLGITGMLDEAAKTGEESAMVSHLKELAPASTEPGLREFMKAGGRTLADKLWDPEKGPLARYKELRPSQLLEHAQMGPQQRTLMEFIGSQNRSLINKTQAWINDVHRAVDTAGISRERMMQLTKSLEQVGVKLTHLEPKEGAFVTFYMDKVRELEHMATDNHLLFHHNGETWSATEDPISFRLHSRMHNEQDPVKKAVWEDKLNTRLDRRISARWKTALQPHIKELLAKTDNFKNMDSQAFAHIMARLDGGDSMSKLLEGVRQGVINHKDINQAIRMMPAEVERLRAMGVDPVYVHHVGGDAVERMNFPRVRLDRATKPSHVLRRTWVNDSYIPDMQVALSHQGMEMLTYDQTHQAIDSLQTSGMMRRHSEVKAEMELYAKRGLGEGSTVGERTQYLMNQNYKRYAPGQLFSFRRIEMERAGLDPNRPSEWLIPKTLQHTIESFQKSLDAATLGKRALRLPTQVFTTSVIRLNPAYYLHMGLSSGTMLMLSTGPSAFFKAAEAWKILSEGGADARLPLGGGGMALPFKSSVDMGDAALQYAAARTAGRWVEEAGGKMHNLATHIHDMQGVMAYLYGETKAARRGLGAEDAKLAGLEQAQKVMMRWDNYTPLERTVMRSFFPFYGWMKHVGQWAVSLPFDHPIRMSILSNFGRNEIDDWKSGLPQRFMSYLFFGKPDAHGQRLGVNMLSFIPLFGLANEFSMAGLASHFNPAIDVMLREMGINTASASPDLYPQWTFDPVSGYRVLKRPNIVGSIFESYIPQFQTLEAVSGLNADLRVLRKTNPQAYLRLITNSTGVRFVPTRYDIPGYITKAAAEQQRAQQSQLQEQKYLQKGQ